MDNQQDQELIKLEHQLNEIIVAEDFFESAPGKLFVNLATKKINKLVQDVTSDKYVKDHAGYIVALADINAYKTMLRMMQVAASPARKTKILERLDGYEQPKSK